MSEQELLCFTNCSLVLEDGTLLERDLWVDAGSGKILDAQASNGDMQLRKDGVERTFYELAKRPSRAIDLGGNILSPGFIDIQINGAYGFDFSIFDGDEDAYVNGLKKVAEKIVETGVTSLVPTIITQSKSQYPSLLSLLRPHSFPSSAHILGWHAEGPFLQPAKRGAHAAPFLLSAPNGVQTFEEVYGTEALSKDVKGVKIVTAAPDVEGVLGSIGSLVQKGVIFSIGHSLATSALSTSAVLAGARLVTHLFNAMPQLHHRDPGIIGLLGSGGPASTWPGDHSAASTEAAKRNSSSVSLAKKAGMARAVAEGNATKATIPHEALEEMVVDDKLASPGPVDNSTIRAVQDDVLERSAKEGRTFERPFYSIIVDGIHSHPNSVRLAYAAHPDGCILVTDAMSMLDPHLPDGVHDWRDGRRLVKQGDRLFIEGTDTLAGSVVTMETCVRNFSLFTSSPLSKAIVCATMHAAKCLGIENEKGTLRAGADADLVVLDKTTGKVVSTWIGGRKVYTAEAK